MQQIVNNNGIQQGFANLAQILAPNANNVIQADLARGRRDLMDAQGAAATRNAATAAGKLDLLRTQDGRAAEIHQNAMALGEALKGLDLATQGGVAGLIGALVGAGADINDPGAAAGYSVMLDPNARNQNELANIFLGTGVVDNFGQTQPGQAQAEAASQAEAVAVQELTNQGDLDVQHAANQGDLDVAHANSVTDLAQTEMGNQGALALQESVNAANMGLLDRKIEAGINVAPGSKPKVYTMAPLDAQRAQEGVAAAIQQATGVKPDGGTVQTIMAAASEIYSGTGNWPAALQQAMSAYDFQTSGLGWADGAPAVSAVPRAPAAPAGGIASQATRSATGPGGKKIYLVGNQWVDESGNAVQ